MDIKTGNLMYHIELLICCNDKEYLGLLVRALNSNFSNRINISSYTDIDCISEDMHLERYDCLLIDESIDTDGVYSTPCQIIYLANDAKKAEINGRPAIFKNSAVDNIYNMILYHLASILPKQPMKGEATVIAFSSPAGGTGCTTTAAACCVNLAHKGKKVVYLDLQCCGNSEKFFNGRGMKTFSDVILSVKRDDDAIANRIQALVKRSDDEVYYFAPCESAIDMSELSDNEILHLVDVLASMDTPGFDYVIVDMPLSLKSTDMSLFKIAQSIVLVSDGSAVSNDKYIRAVEAIRRYDIANSSHIWNKINLLYNKFSGRTGKRLPEELEISMIGGINKLEGVSDEITLVREIAKKDIFYGFVE